MRIQILAPLVACVLSIAVAHAQPVYRIVVVPDLGGGASGASDINNHGHVSGLSFTADGARHAFVFRHGEMEDFGTFPAADSVAISAMNDRDVLAGLAALQPGFDTRAIRWKRGTVIDIGNLGGEGAVAHDVNNRGQIVGFSNLALRFQRAFLWEKGEMRDLGSLSGENSFARGINNRGQVVGVSTVGTRGARTAFLYSDGVMQDIGALLDGQSEATDINDRGQVIGTHENTGQIFLYENGAMRLLPVVGTPDEINNAGQIVGDSNATVGAFLFQDETLYRLHALVDDADPLKSEDTLNYILPRINDRGQIVVGLLGTLPGGRHHSYLLTPISYPRDQLTLLLRTLRGTRHFSDLVQILRRARDHLNNADQPNTCNVLADLVVDLKRHGRKKKWRAPIVRVLVFKANESAWLLGCTDQPPR
jgi:probable HAF family extracellular repeat protein